MDAAADGRGGRRAWTPGARCGAAGGTPRAQACDGRGVMTAGGYGQGGYGGYGGQGALRPG